MKYEKDNGDTFHFFIVFKKLSLSYKFDTVNIFLPDSKGQSLHMELRYFEFWNKGRCKKHCQRHNGPRVLTPYLD